MAKLTVRRNAVNEGLTMEKSARQADTGRRRGIESRSEVHEKLIAQAHKKPGAVPAHRPQAVGGLWDTHTLSGPRARVSN